MRVQKSKAKRRTMRSWDVAILERQKQRCAIKIIDLESVVTVDLYVADHEQVWVHTTAGDFSMGIMSKGRQRGGSAAVRLTTCSARRRWSRLYFSNESLGRVWLVLARNPESIGGANQRGGATNSLAVPDGCGKCANSCALRSHRLEDSTKLPIDHPRWGKKLCEMPKLQCWKSPLLAECVLHVEGHAVSSIETLEPV